MSNGYDSDTDDDFDGNNNEPDWLRNLRKSERTLKREKSELEKRLQEVEKTQRQSSIKSLLEAKGVPAKIATFIPSDVDPTEDAVNKWLDDYGDVFNIQAAEKTQEEPPAEAGNSDNGQTVGTETTQAAALPPEIQAALARLQSAEAGAQVAPATEQAVQKLHEADQNATDFDSFIATYNSAVTRTHGG